ncbi:polyisoprenoid-binding protein [Caulobacter segnis]|uniref:YceI family protein n=2 Tax=Caulobacter segnis TaxID=88688 RepID=D5VHG1_CAUST|nr:YceI family protein [Caulobacter segnis]ADG08819.1 YceI family protein [Caulobacter segnis ATCC 21756]AVQ00663.1 polyisoprenoid-binding protein [Caulobacter segnis]
MFRPYAYAALAATLFAAPAALAAPGVSSTKPADLPAGHYVLDKTHASVVAKIKHMGFSNYQFRFTKVDASFDYDPKAPQDAKIKVTIDPGSIDTSTGADEFGLKFNKELAGDGWLEANKFPTATFVSTKVEPGAGQTGKVYGDFTLHGVTKPIVLDVTFNGVGSGFAPGSVKTGFSASTTIKRSEFGVSKYVPLVGDDVALNIEVEFDKK